MQDVPVDTREGLFDGRWVGMNTGEPMATIRGTNICWADGPVADLHISHDTLACEMFDVAFEARLSAAGHLEWSDGDVWVRSAEGLQAVFQESEQIPEASGTHLGAGESRLQHKEDSLADAHGLEGAFFNLAVGVSTRERAHLFQEAFTFDTHILRSVVSVLASAFSFSRCHFLFPFFSLCPCQQLVGAPFLPLFCLMRYTSLLSATVS